MAHRFYVNVPLGPAGATLDLPSGPTRHTQVLRLQPGQLVTLFDGASSVEWQAEVLSMSRAATRVQLIASAAALRELPLRITLAVVMPANDRMDFLVEKATELGVAVIQPLMSERSVLRLAGDRATKKVAHWQGVALASAEQCGRTHVPLIEAVKAFPNFLAEMPAGGCRLLASPGAPQTVLAVFDQGPVVFLSGPEGGLTALEEAAAAAQKFIPVNLGPRVLRADTAPLAFLAFAALSH